MIEPKRITVDDVVMAYQISEFDDIDTGKAQPLFHTFPVINIFREDEPLPEQELKEKAEEDKLLLGRQGVIYEYSETVVPEVVKRLKREGGNLILDEEEWGKADFNIGLDGSTEFLQFSFSDHEVGLTPTTGLISRYGFPCRVPSLERVSISTKDVKACAELLEVVAGVDKKDPLSRDAYIYNFTDALEDDMTGMKIAVIENFYDMELDQSQQEKFDKMLSVMTEKGAELEAVTLPWEEHISIVNAYISYAESRMTMETIPADRLDNAESDCKEPDYVELRNYGFGELLLSEEGYEKVYAKALKLRSLIKDSYDMLLREYDILAVPFIPVQDSPWEFSYNTYALGAEMAGLPIMAVPMEICDKEQDLIQEEDYQKVFGMYLIAGANYESKLIKAAYTYEQGVK